MKQTRHISNIWSNPFWYIYGNDIKELNSWNKLDILVIFEVSHFEISGNDDKDYSHSLKKLDISLKSIYMISIWINYVKFLMIYIQKINYPNF